MSSHYRCSTQNAHRDHERDQQQDNTERTRNQFYEKRIWQNPTPKTPPRSNQVSNQRNREKYSQCDTVKWKSADNTSPRTRRVPKKRRRAIFN